MQKKNISLTIIENSDMVIYNCNVLKTNNQVKQVYIPSYLHHAYASKNTGQVAG